MMASQRERQQEQNRQRTLTCERRADFTPANISKVQQHALLQCDKNVLGRYLLWGRREGGARGTDGDEFDEEPAVLEVAFCFCFCSISMVNQRRK